MRAPCSDHLYRAMRFFTGVIFFSLCFSSAFAGELNGRVVGVTDGDTLTLLAAGNQQVKIRLAEVDAPEKGQPYGTKAKQQLSDLAFGKNVTVRDTTPDKYGRTVGRIYVGSLDVSKEMVRTGAAWVFTRYSKDPSLPGIQTQARQAQLGLWSIEGAVPPWEWRAGNRSSNNAETTNLTSNSGCKIKGNINSKGDRIYHVPGSRYYAPTKIDTSRGERWFCSESEALSAGWRAPR